MVKQAEQFPLLPYISISCHPNLLKGRLECALAMSPTLIATVSGFLEFQIMFRVPQNYFSPGILKWPPNFPYTSITFGSFSFRPFSSNFFSSLIALTIRFPSLQPPYHPASTYVQPETGSCFSGDPSKMGSIPNITLEKPSSPKPLLFNTNCVGRHRKKDGHGGIRTHNSRMSQAADTSTPSNLSIHPYSKEGFYLDPCGSSCRCIS